MAGKRKPIATKAKEKEKREKIILVVGAVLLLGLLAFEGPKTWNMLNAKPPKDEAHARPRPASTATAAAAAAAAATGATVAPAATAAPAVATGLPTAQPAVAQAVVVPNGIGIAETPSQPDPVVGQLISFGRFRTKDPFVQQVGADAAEPATAAQPATTAPTTTSTTSSPTAPPSSPPATTTSPGPTLTVPLPAAPPVKPSAATIAVNGVSQGVAVNGTFPTADPTFRLASVAKASAKIGLVGGSYSSGAPTITLKVGKTVTLMNTADGTRYKLKLISVS